MGVNPMNMTDGFRLLRTDGFRKPGSRPGGKGMSATSSNWRSMTPDNQRKHELLQLTRLVPPDAERVRLAQILREQQHTQIAETARVNELRKLLREIALVLAKPLQGLDAATLGLQQESKQVVADRQPMRSKSTNAPLVSNAHGVPWQ